MTLRLRHRLVREGIACSNPAVELARVRELEVPSLKCGVDRGKVDRILAGETFTLGMDRSCLTRFEESNRTTYFGDIRPGPDDIRSVWEPARLQHLTLLIACVFEGREDLDLDAVRGFVRKTIFRWLDENPFLCGPHYISAMECGLRIPVFFYCLKCLEFASESEYRKILRAVYCHAWWISSRLSLYSSLGNHTICECVGLVFAGAIYRNTAEAGEWLETAIRLLDQELDHQILDDGGAAEQSLGYHRFILDLYWLVVDFLERNRLHDCEGFKPRLRAAESFLEAFLDEGGNLPSLGDSDGGHAVAPGVNPDRMKTEMRRDRNIQVFRDFGHTVIHTANRALLTFDHGPLGMPPLYNHGHADALSISLSMDGEQILVDSGTYRYTGESAHREYLKGTMAHNTVTVDGLDQAVQVTGFIWSNPYRTTLFRASPRGDGFLVDAGHDGYSRFHEPVFHRRAIRFFDGVHFLCKDSFSGEGAHGFTLNFHLHPDAWVKHPDDWWEIERNGRKIFLRLLGGDDFSPMQGWYSPGYGMLRQSTVLRCIKWGTPDAIEFTTAICTGSVPDRRRVDEIAGEL